MYEFLKVIVKELKEGLNSLSFWERCVHIFWLLGPFFMLIERSPGDIWITLLALMFVLRCLLRREGWWLKYFWVRAALVFWSICLLSAAFSTMPAYSIGEAVAWFRFPLFAMATSFWLGRDKRLLHGMFLSVAIGLIVICIILTAELMIQGQTSGRLYWPYGDPVPGNYLGKVGLPVFTVIVALAVSARGSIATACGGFALITMILSLLTGERTNFLIRACGGMLAGLVWRPKPLRFVCLILAELLVAVCVFMMLPTVANRYTNQLVDGALSENSGWLSTVAGGIKIVEDDYMLGIGPGNYRYLSQIVFANDNYVSPDNHPHNFYVQLYAETGVLGLFFGIVFIGSIIFFCFSRGMRYRENVATATAWVIPFGLFWPIAFSADFFGQWNNTFLWSSVAIALACSHNLKTR